MPAYFIAQIQIEDADEYQNYLAGFMPIFERHGGELLCTSSTEVKIVEGVWDLGRTVLMKFPDLPSANDWYADPDYQALAKHRHASAKANLVLVEGIG